MKIKLKKPADVPPHVQAFIDAVIAAPCLADALNGFSWVYDKVCEDLRHLAKRGGSGPEDDLLAFQGDFSHWVALFNHFEDFYERPNVKQSKDLLLGSAQSSSSEFPVADCLAVLRTTSVLLENTMNKHLFQSYDVSRIPRLSWEARRPS